METVSPLRKYVMTIAKILDRDFDPVDDSDVELQEKVNDTLREDVVGFFDRNISEEMAAEFVAHKLKLPRKPIN